MEQENRNKANDHQSQGESLNAGSTANDQNQSESGQAGGHQQKHSTTMAAGNIGRSATSQVDPHSNSGLANTGTNISYEGATAPGSGGSVGTGYASGKSAVDAKIATGSDEDAAIGRHYDKAEGKDNTGTATDSNQNA